MKGHLCVLISCVSRVTSAWHFAVGCKADAAPCRPSGRSSTAEMRRRGLRGSRMSPATGVWLLTPYIWPGHGALGRVWGAAMGVKLLRVASIQIVIVTQLATSVQGSWCRTGFATNSHDIFNVVRGRLPLHRVVARTMYALRCCALRWLAVHCATSRLSVRRACLYVCSVKQVAACAPLACPVVGWPLFLLRLLALCCGPSWLPVCCAFRPRWLCLRLRRLPVSAHPVPCVSGCIHQAARLHPVRCARVKPPVLTEHL